MTPIDRHSRVALHFSGGKDSLALIHLLRPHWDRLTVYHLDTGDLLPEVQEIVDGVEALMPSFVRIETDSASWCARHGLPSDLMPTSSTLIGRMIDPDRPLLVDRYTCCAANLWAPMHNRMVADGITLVIRGTKAIDLKRLPHGNGDAGAYEIWLPLLDWSHDDVFAYLRDIGAPLCQVYESAVNAPECATCPAWWSEGRAKYLRKYHPDLFATYRAKLAAVTAELQPHLAALQVENE